jgi:hypothetical protein
MVSHAGDRMPLPHSSGRSAAACGPGVPNVVVNNEDHRSPVGRGEKGLLIMTGRFTVDARREANRDGATPIEVIDGDKLCDLLKKHGLGVTMTVRQVADVTVDAVSSPTSDAADSTARRDGGRETLLNVLRIAFGRPWWQ